MTDIAHQSTRPITESERASVLDALRAFALLGIFVSHVPDFSGYNFMAANAAAALDRFGSDNFLATFADFLIRGKFVSLFSFLFGIGFAIQLESATKRGADFSKHFRRRLLVLATIGFAHSFVWYGDILKDYALIGLLLIPLAKWSLNKLLITAGIVFLLRAVWPLLIFYAVPLFDGADPQANPGAGFADLAMSFQSNDLAQIVSVNLQLLQIKALQMIYDGKAVSILAMFLLGALVGKQRLYRNLADHRSLLTFVFLVCLPVGLVGNMVLVSLHANTPDFPPTVDWVIEQFVFAVAVPALAISYAAGFALLWVHGGDRLLKVIAPAGRMALTTYVSQSLIGIALFYGVGLGWGGKIGFTEGLALAISIFSAQCIISHWWLNFFQFGPLEWLWRRATYRQPVAMLRAASPVRG